MRFKRSDLPSDFLFAAASSSYQIAGHVFGGASQTQWDTFAATPSNVVRAENGARACAHYHRYAEDLHLMQTAGFDGNRFSTSWARVLPEGRGAPNTEGQDVYDRLVDAMLDRDLKPMATIFHGELPVPLADLGGCRNPGIPNWFSEYTDVIMRRIGDRVFSVAPINGPWCIAWLGHFTREHAPGVRDIRAAAHAMHHVLKPHGSAVQVMRGLGLETLDAVFNFEYAHPVDASPPNQEAAARYDQCYNLFFLSGVFKSSYPALAFEGLDPHLPRIWHDGFVTITQPLDWCGLNYNTCARIGHQDGSWPKWRAVPGTLPKTQMGWEIYPEGLAHFLDIVPRQYTGALPLYVTENGMASAGDGTGSDADRTAYLDAHLAVAKASLARGVPLKGYTFWSLLDNYEWALGYEKQFGLVEVDRNTLARRPKPSFHEITEALTR